MTPTGQDEELREKLADALRTGYHGIAETKVINHIMQLITADRKRDALEARIDELKKVDMLTKPSLPNSGSVETNVKAWVKDRLPQLKAQQEEV